MKRAPEDTESLGCHSSPDMEDECYRKRASSIADEKALVASRSVAKRRRQNKRQELEDLEAEVGGAERHLQRLDALVNALNDAAKRWVWGALEENKHKAPLGCRFCNVPYQEAGQSGQVLYDSVDGLVEHMLFRHAVDLKSKGGGVEEIKAFAVELPDAAELNTLKTDSDSESESEDETNETSMDSSEESAESKRRVRLRRNAASARKSRMRKRMMLERWRMTLPALRFRALILEMALAALPRSAVVPAPYAEQPDVVAAAFALISCAVVSPGKGFKPMNDNA